MEVRQLPYVRRLVSRESILTDRVKKIKDAVLRERVHADWERDHLLTEYWKQSNGEPILVRRAKAFDKILTEKEISIFDGELIVGSQTKYLNGSYFYPEYNSEWIEREWEQLATRESDKIVPDEGQKALILEDLQFWKGNSLHDQVHKLWAEKWGTWPKDIVDNVVATALGGHCQGRQIPDFPKLLQKGLKGLIAEAEEMIAKADVFTVEDLEKHYFWQATIIACHAVIKFAKRYAALAREMAKRESHKARKRELEKIAQVCDRVPENPPRTFHEALQFVWFVHLCEEIEEAAFGWSFGRFDQYLYPFYKKDIEGGRITREEAAELLACFWLKCASVWWVTQMIGVMISQASMFQNITIGGQDKDGEGATNELSHLIVEVDTALKLRQPTLSLRYSDRIGEDFLFKVGEDIATGGGKPAIFCEKYCYSVLPLYGVALEDVVEFTPVGCVEFAIPGKTPLLSGYFLGLPGCLEFVFNNGIHPRTGKKLGLETGDVESFPSFDEFMDAFIKQVTYVNKICSNMCTLENGTMRADLVPRPFSSALISDCIAKGKGIYKGGARYNQLYAVYPYGLITAINSLYAIKKLVYDDKVISMRKLKEAVAANFEGDGHERIRKLCMDAPKYGNDIDEVDWMVKDMFAKLNKIVMAEKNPWGYPVAPAYLGTTAWFHLGIFCGATPDGRKAHTPFADGSLSAYPGTDMTGPTAMIKSATKANPSPALATLFNMKFQPSVFDDIEGMRKFWTLVKTYSDLGGYHVQFNVVDRDTLLKAKANPEQYKDLLIRVAGFSAYFVDLSPFVQDQIIARTEHAF